ncbi:MAG: formate dehydrogenase accessory sulfurtransferase FdhD [Dethiobacter sp.]|nr:formate dehydrogenase accessory sulfurtransferase FdhD [Dethiobacter sp.]MBS3901451.1 formate dehydrogenase accessory sulfurtransferase FdhD [Dethiobacter sp.]
MDERMEQKSILRTDAGGMKQIADAVIRENPLTIYLNGQELVTLLSTPELADMLAVGFLRSEGLIRDYADISSLRVDEGGGFVFVETEGGSLAEKLYGKRTITSGCGKGTVFFSVLDSLKTTPVQSTLRITYLQVINLSRILQEKAVLFEQTGGVHSAALCTPTEVIYFCEDIGRHNAVDKIVGLCLKNMVAIREKVLVTSGRISSEILVKTARLGIPLIISRAAPTTLSVELAEKLGITLIGFVRGSRFNIYSHSERVLL